MLKKLGVVLAFGVGGRDNAGMRGTVDAQLSMLSTLSTEDLIGSDHPIRRIRAVDVLQEPAAAFGPRDRGPVLRRGGGPSASGGRGRNLGADWRGARRRNHTHRSTTDPEARLFRKSAGAAAMLCFMGHLLIENRNGLIIDAELTRADGRAERDTAAAMLHRAPERERRRTVAGDRNYDTAGFVADARAAGFTPHVAQNNTRRRSAIDGRTTRHGGYRISQQARKRVEEPFGWIKTIAGGRKLRHKGRQRNRAWYLIAAATYNLVRIARLDAPTT